MAGMASHRLHFQKYSAVNHRFLQIPLRILKIVFINKFQLQHCIENTLYMQTLFWQCRKIFSSASPYCFLFFYCFIWFWSILLFYVLKQNQNLPSFYTKFEYKWLLCLLFILFPPLFLQTDHCKSLLVKTIFHGRFKIYFFTSLSIPFIICKNPFFCSMEQFL